MHLVQEATAIVFSAGDEHTYAKYLGRKHFSLETSTFSNGHERVLRRRQAWLVLETNMFKTPELYTYI